LRSQESSHIIQISSIGGLITGPMTGIYSASKFALEGFSESLAQEAAHFGVHVSIVKEEIKPWMDLQIVALPQEGLYTKPDVSILSWTPVILLAMAI